jgi:hypothetical protein
MAKSTLSRHGRIRVAAAVSLGGLILAACSPMSDQPAPVYMVNIVSTAPETAAGAPIVREMAGPVALAPSMAPATAVAHPASDAIALDNPPPQPAPAPARQTADSVAAQPLPPPPAPASTSGPSPTPTLVASSAPIAPPSATLPVAASARPEPSAAAEARAEAAPPPVRERVTAEPARADIATPALYVSVKADRAAHPRPRYYYSP